MIYLDNNATTPLRKEVKNKIIEVMEIYGNPSSHHDLGVASRKVIENARAEIASFINAEPSEIFFTSCGSESNNIVLRACGCATGGCCTLGSKNIITSAIEHPSIKETCHCLSTSHTKIQVIPVDNMGNIDPADIDKAINDQTGIVTIMYANNEIGTIQPIKEIAEIAHKKNALFHTDAVQALGKIPIDVKELNCDFMSLSGHKIYAPKGIGVLYVKKGKHICPLISGGHQEHGVRAGTENVIGIAAFGEATRILKTKMNDEIKEIRRLRDMLKKYIADNIEDIHFNGNPDNMLDNTINVSFRFIEGEAILYRLNAFGVAVSTGSACSSGSLEPSHVLTSIGLPIELAHSSVRISLGHETTENDIIEAGKKLKETVEFLRKISPLKKGK